MPYKITNITAKSKRFKHPVPLSFKIDNGSGIPVTHTIQPNDSIVLWVIPKQVHELQIRDAVTVEFITENTALPKPSPSKLNTSIPSIPTPKNEIEEKNDFIKNEEIEDSEENSEEKPKRRIKKSEKE